MDTKQCPVDILSINNEIKENELFKGLNTFDLGVDNLNLNIINLKTGETLFRQGDRANSIFLIVDGEINLIHKQSFGKTHTNLFKNNFLGHIEYFLKTDRNSIAIALKDSCIVELSKENIETLISRDKSFLNNIKNSFFNLDSASINQFENVFTELPGLIENSSVGLPIDTKTTVDEKPPNAINNKISNESNSHLPAYDAINPNKVKSELNKTSNKSNGKMLGIEKTAENIDLTENDLKSKIADLKFQLSTTVGRLILYSQQFNEQKKLVELKGKENLNLQQNIAELNNILKENNDNINVLNNKITQLKNELSEVNKLKEEFNSPKIKHIANTDEYNEIIKENSLLSDQIKSLKLQVEAHKNAVSKPSYDNELNNLKTELEKYKRSIFEKDKIIKEQKENIENIGLVNSGALKAIVSVKNSCSEKLKIKDDEIVELKEKLKLIQQTLDEKVFLENQQAQTIDRQAQKIAELELPTNVIKEKSDSPITVKEEKILTAELPKTNSVEQSRSNESDEIFSKCKLINIAPVDASLTDGTFEHFQEADIQIINVNLSRATMEVVTIFNEFLDGIISREKNKIIVNLLDCEFIDSSILGALVKNLKKATSLGGDLRLVGFHPAVHSMMELTRMLRLFEYFSTLEAAIRSFK